jgi:hypothetical protein
MYRAAAQQKPHGRRTIRQLWSSSCALEAAVVCAPTVTAGKALIVSAETFIARPEPSFDHVFACGRAFGARLTQALQLLMSMSKPDGTVIEGDHVRTGYFCCAFFTATVATRPASWGDLIRNREWCAQFAGELGAGISRRMGEEQWRGRDGRQPALEGVSTKKAASSRHPLLRSSLNRPRSPHGSR